MNKAYLLIGGNMGDKAAYLLEALTQINEQCGRVVKQSPVYETAAWGLMDQEAFLNQALEIVTSLSPFDLLNNVLAIEKNLGRLREVKYGPRLIDIDILLFNDEVISTEMLGIPHPEMQNRRFVLVPLAEIAPDEIHPVFKKNISTLLNECNDKLDVKKFEPL